MNKEDIQKLIGGYATGSLTEEERRSLFEAALDDQELFDTLQNEQALKELLDDPLSREQIRRAAAESLPSAKRSWFRLPWLWAAGASVAAAAVLLVVLLQPSPQMNRVAQSAPPKQIAASPAQPQLDVQESAPAVQDKKSAKAARGAKPAKPVNPAEPVDKIDKEEPRAVAPPPSPPPAAVQMDQVPSGPSQARVNQIQSLEAKDASRERAPVSEQTASSPVTGFRAKTLAAPAMGRMSATPARTIYSLARRLDNGAYLDVPVDTMFQPGEIIRLVIFARDAGPLTIMEWDAGNSQWNRVFPLEGETVQAPALENYVVPRDIMVKPGERLRVTVGPVATEIAIRTTAAR